MLSRYGAEDRKIMEDAFSRAAEAAVLWADEGIDRAMQAGNRTVTTGSKGAHLKLLDIKQHPA